MTNEIPADCGCVVRMDEYYAEAVRAGIVDFDLSSSATSVYAIDLDGDGAADVHSTIRFEGAVSNRSGDPSTIRARGRT